MQVKNNKNRKFLVDLSFTICYNDNGVFADTTKRLSDSIGRAEVLSAPRDYRTTPITRLR